MVRPYLEIFAVARQNQGNYKFPQHFFFSMTIMKIKEVKLITIILNLCPLTENCRHNPYFFNYFTIVTWIIHFSPFDLVFILIPRFQ